MVLLVELLHSYFPLVVPCSCGWCDDSVAFASIAEFAKKSAALLCFRLMCVHSTDVYTPIRALIARTCYPAGEGRCSDAISTSGCVDEELTVSSILEFVYGPVDGLFDVVQSVPQSLNLAHVGGGVGSCCVEEAHSHEAGEAQASS